MVISPMNGDEAELARESGLCGSEALSSDEKLASAYREMGAAMRAEYLPLKRRAEAGDREAVKKWEGVLRDYSSSLARAKAGDVSARNKVRMYEATSLF